MNKNKNKREINSVESLENANKKKNKDIKINKTDRTGYLNQSV